MTEKEERVWAYILANRNASANMISEACDVSWEFAVSMLSKIGTDEALWRNVKPESSLDRQEGGSHYKAMAVQPWEAMEAWLTAEEYRGYHKGVAIAYLARERQKGGDGDIKKAVHHLQRLIETLEGRG